MEDFLNTVYVKSNYIQSVIENESAIIWHSLFGHPQVVTIDTLKFLDLFLEPTSITSNIDFDLTEEDEESIKELIKYYFLIPLGFEERVFLQQQMQVKQKEIENGSQINYLELIMSEVCNFRCTYCIHFSNLEIHDRIKNKNLFMDFETAKNAIDKYIDILRVHNKKIAEINFGGGEPLMAWDIIEKVLEYCLTNFGKELKFVFSINTNASLITVKIAKSLKRYGVEIASSLDGLEEPNNRVRITKQGSGTYNQIVKGFDTLSLVGYPVNGIAVTINEDNFFDLDETIIDWARERGMDNVRIDIDIIGTVAISIEEIVSKFLRIRSYAKLHNIEVPGFWLRPAENLNESTIEKNVSFCGGTRGNSICVSPAGNIYSCGYSSMKIGSVFDKDPIYKCGGAYSDFVASHFTGNIPMCHGCAIEGQCNGGCNITHEFAKAAKSAKIDRMCEFYRTITKEILHERLRELIL